MWKKFPSPPRTYVRADGRIERGGNRLRRMLLGEQMVISRAMCHFELMPAPAGRAGIRNVQAAMLAAKARTPIRDPQFHLDWHGDQVGVWSWSKASLDPFGDFEGSAIPETVLQSPGDGQRIVQTLEGVEGQIWVNRMLIASRWWPAEPDAAQWRDFLRASRSTGNGNPPPVESPRPRSSPPKRPLAAQILSFRTLRWRDAGAIALLTMVTPMLFLGTQWVHLSLQERKLTDELSILRASTSELNAARERAQTAARELARYAEVIDEIHPMQLLAVFGETVASHNAQLDQFTLREGALSIAISASADFAPAPLVQELEGLPEFTGVFAEPGRRPGQWRIQAEVATS